MCAANSVQLMFASKIRRQLSCYQVWPCLENQMQGFVCWQGSSIAPSLWCLNFEPSSYMNSLKSCLALTLYNHIFFCRQGNWSNQPCKCQGWMDNFKSLLGQQAKVANGRTYLNQNEPSKANTNEPWKANGMASAAIDCQHIWWPANMWLICFVILKPVKANVFAVLLQSVKHMVH